MAAPRKRAPAKKAAPAKPTAGAAGTDGAAAGDVPAAPPPLDDGLSLNQWLHDINSKPLSVEVFDRWWEFKQPTGGRAVTWDTLLGTKGIRAALSSMMLDETAAPERTWTDAEDQVHVLEALPGSARADEFLAVANQWIPPEAAEEFWRRMERALFGPGEASAS